MTTESHSVSAVPPTGSTECLLANRYQVVRILGEGGFGTTYLATDTQMPSHRTCVVKQLKPINDSPQISQLVQERFQREAAILERLGSHSSQIPDLYAYFSEAEKFFLVEEWVAGETLVERIESRGCMTESDVRTLLLQLLSILDFVHQQQMMHRDIKPENIILRQDGAQPVLIDFGSVKEVMGTMLDSQGDRSIVVGTPGFMSPEQSAGRPTFSSDLYSLGMTAIFLLTGRYPQDLDPDLTTGKLNWRNRTSQVSDGLAQVIERATSMQLQARFTTVSEMRQALIASDSSEAWQSTVVSQPHVTPTPIPVPQIIPPLMNSAASSASQAVFTPPVATPLVSPQSTTPQSSIQSSNDWVKAVIIGGLVGLSILGGTLIIRAHLSSREDSDSDSNPTSNTASTPKTASSGSPLLDISGVSPNATVSGNSGRKNLRAGPGTSYAVLGNVYPGDRIQVVGNEQESNGFTWYEVIAPSVRVRGWVAHHLVTFDNAPTRSAPPRAQTGTNATVVGGGLKNIRSGPGTVNGVVGQLATGDRVQIMGQAQDRGGYTWYRVAVGNQQGWIAAQLIDPD